MSYAEVIDYQLCSYQVFLKSVKINTKGQEQDDEENILLPSSDRSMKIIRLHNNTLV